MVIGGAVAWRASAWAAPGVSAMAARLAMPAPAKALSQLPVSRSSSPPNRWVQPVMSIHTPSGALGAASGV